MYYVLQLYSTLSLSLSPAGWDRYANLYTNAQNDVATITYKSLSLSKINYCRRSSKLVHQAFACKKNSSSVRKNFSLEKTMSFTCPTSTGLYWYLKPLLHSRYNHILSQSFYCIYSSDLHNILSNSLFFQSRRKCFCIIKTLNAYFYLMSLFYVLSRLQIVKYNASFFECVILIQKLSVAQRSLKVPFFKIFLKPFFFELKL